jgi:hypothetical protein
MRNNARSKMTAGQCPADGGRGLMHVVGVMGLKDDAVLAEFSGLVDAGGGPICIERHTRRSIRRGDAPWL